MRKPKKKDCQLREEDASRFLDYKDTTLLRKFIDDGDKFIKNRIEAKYLNTPETSLYNKQSVVL